MDNTNLDTSYSSVLLRLRKLERANRSLRAVMLLFMCILAAVSIAVIRYRDWAGTFEARYLNAQRPIIQVAKPASPPVLPPPVIPEISRVKEIRAKRIILEDGDGRSRFDIGMSEHGARIQFFDDHLRRLMEIGQARPDGTQILGYNKNEGLRFIISSDENQALLKLFGGGGYQSTAMSVDGEGANVSVQTKAGTVPWQIDTDELAAIAAKPVTEAGIKEHSPAQPAVTKPSDVSQPAPTPTSTPAANEPITKITVLGPTTFSAAQPYANDFYKTAKPLSPMISRLPATDPLWEAWAIAQGRLERNFPLGGTFTMERNPFHAGERTQNGRKEYLFLGVFRFESKLGERADINFMIHLIRDGQSWETEKVLYHKLSELLP